jgi:hypothetical protein
MVDCFSFDYNDDLECHQMEGACAKGKLISKYIFGIFNSPKKRTKQFN